MSGEVEARALVAQLAGQALRSVQRNEHWWRFDFDSAYVATTSSWRVSTSHGIALCSADDGQMFGRPWPVDALEDVSDSLVGQTVVSADAAPLTADLRLDFSSGRRLEILNLSAGHEAWDLTYSAHPQEVVVAMGGGALVVSQASPSSAR